MKRSSYDSDSDSDCYNVGQYGGKYGKYDACAAKIWSFRCKYSRNAVKNLPCPCGRVICESPHAEQLGSPGDTRR
eukprot:1137426-Pyramimonas_sp.AAC.1